MLKKLVFPVFWLINFLVIFYFWYLNSFPFLTSGTAGALTALGRLTGLIAVFLVLLQFIFMGREVWLEQIIGLDRLTRIHHSNGQLSFIFILSHPALLLFGYARAQNTGVITQFLSFINDYDDVLQAFLAVIIFVVVGVLSYSLVKKNLKYEFWYIVHLAVYLAIILAWGHQLENGQDFQNSLFRSYWYLLYAFVFGNVLFYRFLRPLRFFLKNRFVVLDNIPETKDTNSIYIAGKSLKTYPIIAGQFMILRFLDRNNWWKPHPFSLSKGKSFDSLRVTIKNSGDFTSQVNRIKKGTPVLIDGPYGVFTLPKKANKLLFIAGGIGITPIRSMLQQAAKEKRDIILLYSNKTSQDIVFKKELDKLSDQYNFPVRYFLTQENNNRMLKGRIDTESIRKFVPDIVDREIFICGPAAMIEQVKLNLTQLKVKSSKIHYEKFSL